MSEVYGFNKSDSQAILARLTAGESPTESRGHRFRLLMAQSKSGGIAANNKAMVFLREETTTGWTTSTREVEAWNDDPTGAIGADKRLILGPVNGRWVVLIAYC